MSHIISRVISWADHRTGLRAATRRFLLEELPASAGWPQVFGSVALFAFFIQVITGLLLALNYAATPSDAYDSVTYIVREVSGGRMIRGLHHWGASLMIIVVCLHMAQVFCFGAFKRPRETTWISGVGLLLLTLGFGLTGYLLPGDNKAYWGTMVTTQIAAGLPVVGPVLTQLLGATPGIGAITFSRFYALHTLLLPTVSAGLIGFHVYLVRRHGIATDQPGLEDTQRFYPKQLFRDLCAVLVAFFCLFLAASFLDAPLERVADPTDTSYVPRPEWYFLFLFQLLKMFPGRLELIGTLVIPSLAVLVLVLLPFLNPAHATVLRGRLRSFAVLASVFGIWAGLTAMAGWTPPRARAHGPLFAQPADWVRIAPEVIAGAGFFQTLHCGACHDLIVGTPKPGPSLGVAGIEHPREWLLEHFDAESKLSLPERNALVIFVASLNPGSLRAITSIPASFSRGAQIYVASACASCHKVNGTGGNFGPALNGVAERRSDAWVHAHFLAPQRLSPKSVMPPYRFSTDDEKALTSYLFSLPN